MSIDSTAASSTSATECAHDSQSGERPTRGAEMMPVCFRRRPLRSDSDVRPSGRRALIGERVYPVYVRQLRLWLVIVVPVLAVIGTVGAASGDSPTVGSVVVGMLGGAATAVLQVCFWVTAVFALVERTTCSSSGAREGVL